jgi:succinate dehydrogenase/fumarate reductase flavoprotein subunit
VKTDVAVVGGGPAGIAAVVAATAAGARTALVERQDTLGGNATSGLVGTICGLYVTQPEGQPVPANEGFPRSFAERLAALPGCGGPLRQGRVHVLPYAPFAFAWLADRLVADEASVDLHLRTHLVGAETSGRRVVALHLAGPGGPFDLEPAAVVDCTGDGILARSVGAAAGTDAGAGRQAPALVFVLQHVDTEGLRGPRGLSVLRALAAGEEAGRLPRCSSHLVFRPSGHPGELVLKLTLSGLFPAPGRDDVTLAAVEGRRRIAEIVWFLGREQPAFARAFLSHVAPQVGRREVGTLEGRYRLTREDVLGGRRFDDVVARGAWPIELWEEGRRGATYEHLEDGATYDIPRRCLEALGFDNLFAAGRCLSATHEALGSARVIGTALATGEAAGQAAAIAAGQA